MASSLDMSLDDLIKSRGNSERGRGRAMGRGRGRGSGGRGRGRGIPLSRRRAAGIGPRGPLGVNMRQSAYSVAKSFNRAKDLMWQHDLLDDGLRAAGLLGRENDAKLFVSNLDLGVTNEDIRELFSEVGELIKCTLHYDRHGRSNGSAEVVFAKRSDALAAVKRYNNVQLDGKPMKIELIGTNLGVPLPLSARVNVVGTNGRGRRRVIMGPGTSRRGGRSFPFSAGRRGALVGGRGRGRGRSRGRKLPSVDDLDKELEAYHTDAAQ